MAGYQLTSGQMEAIRAAVMHYRHLFRGDDQVFPPSQQQRHITGKLDGDLVAAIDFANTPATAILSKWARGSDGIMYDTGENIDVVNRFENTETLTTGTIVQCEWIDGEWRVYAADCEGA